jgi:acyl-coenzyme A thioesterase PaaI-like protein
MILTHSMINFRMAVPEFLMTDKKESFRSRWFRRLMNVYPMYRGTGGKIVFWSSDSSEVHLRLGLNLWTRNYVGTIFGGSLFAAADPFHMLMLMKQLGPQYVVWDKAASIRFKRPARSRLYAVLRIAPEELEMIRQEVSAKGHVTRPYTIRWLDTDGQVYAEIERQCYIADKSIYEKRKGEIQSPRF